jgi:hypothetical protein
MEDKTILSKTAKGREEIETRKHKLEQRLRAVLITINGKLTAGELAKQFSTTSDIRAVLDRLVGEGFAQAALDPAARLAHARSELARLVSASLGPQGDSIAMKLEGARTMEELRAYLESKRAFFDEVLREKKAAFWARAAELTG